MKKKLPMSALITGLLAAPVLGAPVNTESRAPGMSIVETAEIGAGFPARMPLEVGERMKRWARGERPDTYGMQALQRNMVSIARDRVARALAGAFEPAISDHKWTREHIYPVQFLLTDPRNGFLLADQLNAQAPLEKTAFLGITTTSVNAPLRAQLGLPRGMGLLIEYVEKDSPADQAGLKVNDVLQKLDDQLLINEQQLQVLVRAHKPGETIKLTLLRAAAPLTVNAKLVEKELPMLEPPPALPLAPVAAAGMDAMPDFLQESHGTVTRQVTGSSTTIHLDGSMSKRVADTQNDITLNKAADGKETVLVKDRDGHTLYDGAIEGMEKSDLTAEVAKKVHAIEKEPNQVTIHVGTGSAAVGNTTTAVSRTYTLTREDGEHSITLRRDANGQKIEVIERASGKILYSGPGSDQDLKSLAPAVAEKVKALVEKTRQ